MGWPSIAGSGTCLIRSALPMWTLTTARLVRKAADGSPLWNGTGWYDDTLAHTPVAGGSAAGSAASPGGPVTRRSTEGIPGVKFDLATGVLRREADAGRIGVLGAHANPDV